MFQKYVFALCVCLSSVFCWAQNTELTSILQQIANNNQELLALKSLQNSRQLAQSTENNLPNPEFNAFYLPFGNHNSWGYAEFDLSQSFEFPSVYKIRKDILDEGFKNNELQYQLAKQTILLEAKKWCIEANYTKQQIAVVKQRTEQARKVFEQINLLFNEGQIGILDLNKAKIAWMQTQFSISELEAQQKKTLIELEKINGGQAIDISGLEIEEQLTLDSFETLWNAKATEDPFFTAMIQEEKIAKQKIELSKRQNLPNFTTGVNYQNSSGIYYSGIYGGLSIPLWNGRNKVQTAQTQSEYILDRNESKKTKVLNELKINHQEYSTLYEQYQNFREMLQNIDSEELLLESYEVGHISFLEYYLEITFYQKAWDDFLLLEKKLHLLQAEINKHQLSEI